jgi:DNA invertase Pin-like site-specific DNA recombinase
MNAPDTAAPLGPVHGKIRLDHLNRLAVVYVRQSTPRQVAENRESTDLQYKLADRAVALGWRADRVLVIDDDLGQSAQSAADRAGFQRLLAEVGLNHVGLILGSEMSRLARSCKDWYQLLELCGLFGTLLADADGVYDPTDPNDRMLLGLRGMMSEAELHVLRGRLLQGKRNKARRGELHNIPPVGYVRLPSGEPALDPDEQVRSVVRLVFERFAELGTVRGVVRYFRGHSLRLPIRPHGGPDRGRLEWRVAGPATISNMLRHPLYAGAYCYGRSYGDPRRKIPGRRHSGRVRRPAGEWEVLLRDRLPAYISWAQYEANQKRLRANRWSPATPGSPLRGAALLAGLMSCACGWKMYTNYRGRCQAPRYTCNHHGPGLGGGQRRCPTISASGFDVLIARLALEALTPAAVELHLSAAADLEREAGRLESHWRQQLERAQYEVERAGRQYQACEPENRLVARELERRWEQALRDYQRLTEEHARVRQSSGGELTEADRQRVRTLAADLPGLWESAGPADRKEILRRLIERVVVAADRSEAMTVTIHWAGGGTSTHPVSRPVWTYEHLGDFDRLLERIRDLRAAGQPSGRIAATLNAEGFRSPRREGRFTADKVRQIVLRRGLKERIPVELREAVVLGADEVWMTDLAAALEIPVPTLTAWCRKGWVYAWKVATPEPRWAMRADAKEKDRLRRLAAGRAAGLRYPYPAELTTPTGQPKPEK